MDTTIFTACTIASIVHNRIGHQAVRRVEQQSGFVCKDGDGFGRRISGTLTVNK